jgi:predicted Fe-Mo cluster-binding NifX family protein
MKDINKNTEFSSPVSEGLEEAFRIAITTTDNQTVNQHFGKATCFSIYEIDAGQLKLVETREAKAYCQSEEEQPGTNEHSFSDERLDAVYETIKDCKMLYTKQIGDKPGAALLQKGIEIKPCSCNIEQIVGCSGNCK